MFLSATYGLDLSRIVTPLAINVQHNPLKVVLRLTCGGTNIYWCRQIQTHYKEYVVYEIYLSNPYARLTFIPI